MRIAAAWARAVGATTLLASVMSPLGTPEQVGASVPDASASAVDSTEPPAAGAPLLGQRWAQNEAEEDGGPANGGDGTGVAEPMLRDDFALAGTLLTVGLVGLDWDDVAGASGYELLFSRRRWLAVAVGESISGQCCRGVREGPRPRVGGLSQNAVEYWFAVRARSADGVSRWSSSISVAAGDSPEAEVPFDPFTEPTMSGIDLERLGEATATVAAGEADCSAVPALSVAAVSMVDAPADLNDPGRCADGRGSGAHRGRLRDGGVRGAGWQNRRAGARTARG